MRTAIPDIVLVALASNACTATSESHNNNNSANKHAQILPQEPYQKKIGIRFRSSLDRHTTLCPCTCACQTPVNIKSCSWMRQYFPQMAFARSTRSFLSKPLQFSSPKPFLPKNQFSKRTSQLPMSLIPTPINELQSILAIRAPTGDQYVTYLGRTPRERFNTLFEGSSVAFLGTMFAYFISFVIGQFLATLLGTIFLFWPILSPEFKAYQRNWELCGGRDMVDVWMDDEDGDWEDVPFDKRGLYGAYYVTRIEDVCVVDDVRAPSNEEYDLDEFQDYTMENDELESVTGLPWKLRLRLLDDEGRGMQVHCRMSEEYLDIEPGMSAVGVLVSTSRDFVELAAMTDFCILDAGPAWVGDYPYLEKDSFLRTLEGNGIINDLWESEYEEEKGVALSCNLSDPDEID